MASSISTSLTAVGVTATLPLGEQLEDVSYSVSGTFVATWYLQRASTPDGTAWVNVLGPFTAAATGTVRCRANDKFRIICTAFTSGQLDCSLSEADAPVWELKDRNGTVLCRVTQDGASFFGTFGISGNATLSGQFRLAQKTPSAADDTGVANTFAFDANYVYVCTATNTWKRAAIATWP